MAIIEALPPSVIHVPWDSEVLFEIESGERKEIPRMGALAGTLASMLGHFLQAFAFSHRLGLAFVEVLFRFPGHTRSRRPDVAFVRYERWPHVTTPTQDPDEWDTVPNLAVEMVSPTHTVADIDEKVETYFDAGVELVWVIYPLRRRIHVFDSPTSSRILSEDDEFDGGTVLPGFRLAIRDLFSSLIKPNKP